MVTIIAELKSKASNPGVQDAVCMFVDINTNLLQNIYQVNWCDLWECGKHQSVQGRFLQTLNSTHRLKSGIMRISQNGDYS